MGRGGITEDLQHYPWPSGPKPHPFVHQRRIEGLLPEDEGRLLQVHCRVHKRQREERRCYQCAPRLRGGREGCREGLGSYPPYPSWFGVEPFSLPVRGLV